jgi:predicted transcriptional regulator
MEWTVVSGPFSQYSVAMILARSPAPSRAVGALGSLAPSTTWKPITSAVGLLCLFALGEGALSGCVFPWTFEVAETVGYPHRTWSSTGRRSGAQVANLLARTDQRIQTREPIPSDRMVSQAEVDRLRLEADTILTRHEAVQEALDRARSESGSHWDRGELTLSLETPRGEAIDVTIDLESAAAANAQSRYERAKTLEAELERKRGIVGQLAPLPADPVAYLICYHLDAVEGNYPRSMAGHLDAERDRVERLCEAMETADLLERVESGTVKNRRVKAKQADEVRQHHTYYRLSRDGDHLLRLLDEPDGRLNVLRHLPDGRTLLQRLTRGGPDYPRMTADELDMAFEYVRHLYRALRQAGLVSEYEGSTIKGTERKLKPKDETHRKHTYYVATDRGEQALGDLEG